MISRRLFLYWFTLGYLASVFPQSCASFIAETPSSVTPIIFYVASYGQDTWSGKLAAPNKTKTDGPFATLKKARDTIRQLKQEQGGVLKQPVTIFLRQGTYFLSESLLFTSEDSGTEGCPITYAAYQNEKPIISGGKPITGWQKITINGKKLWRVQIPEVQNNQWFFRQLWVNNQRRVRARYPNQGYLRVAAVPDVTSKTPWNQGQTRFNYDDPNITQWRKFDHGEAVVMTRWVESRLSITKVDPVTKTLYFDRRSVFRLAPGDLFYLENVFDALDTPGEWYLEKSSGYLYYIPKSGEKINELEFIAPILSGLLTLKGNPTIGNWVEHLHFEGLTFAHCEWYYPPDFKASWPRPDVAGFPQAAVGVPGAISTTYTRHCLWKNCTIAHISNYGLEFSGSCQKNQVMGCNFFDLGAGGVKIQSAKSSSGGGHSITHCHIYNGGLMFPSAVGILLQSTPNNRVAYNHIHNFYYTAISVGWTWGYKDNPTKNNIIEFNHIHHIGKLSNGEGPILNALAGIYTLGKQPETIIRSNIIHHVTGLGLGNIGLGEMNNTASGRGLFLDEGTSYILIENNLVYHTDVSLHQHYGQENVVRNNIFALAKTSQISRVRQEPHLSFTLERNIIYWRDGKLLAGNWKDSNYQFNHNLYWRVGDGKINFDGLSWQEWQKKGMDKDSLIANPKFIAPERDNFQLQSDSPAFKIGFHPIPMNLRY